MFGRLIRVMLGQDPKFVPDTSLEFHYNMDLTYEWEPDPPTSTEDNTPVMSVPATSSMGSSVPVSTGEPLFPIPWGFLILVFQWPRNPRGPSSPRWKCALMAQHLKWGFSLCSVSDSSGAGILNSEHKPTSWSSLLSTWTARWASGTWNSNKVMPLNFALLNVSLVPFVLNLAIPT